jgi:thioredoxin reductase
MKEVAARDGEMVLRFTKDDGADTELVVDHVIGATGFKVDVSRLKFLDEELRRNIRTVDNTPALSTSFESSVPGLYMVGVASTNCFGPLTRFACGAEFTAKRLTRHLARKAR